MAETISCVLEYFRPAIDPVRYLSIYSAVLPLLFGFRRRPAILWLYVLVGFICDLIITYALIDHIGAKRAAGNVYFLLEFFMLSLYFRDKLVSHNNVKIANWGIVTLGVLYVTGTLLSTFYKFNNYGVALFYFSFLIYCIAGLRAILIEQRSLYLEHSEFFWTSVGILLYSSLNFIVVLFVTYLLEWDKQCLGILWVLVHGTSNLLLRILLTIALTRRYA